MARKLFSLLILASLLVGQTQAADRLQLLDGSTVEANISAIDSAGVVKLAGSNKTYELQSLRGLRRSSDQPKPSEGVAAEFFLARGGAIMATSMNYKNEKFQLKWQYPGELKVDLGEILAIKFLDKELKDSPVHQRALKATLAKRGQKDQLLIRVKKTVQPIAGLLEDITEEHIVFQWDGESQKFARKKVYALVMAKLDELPSKTGTCLAMLKDGSSLAGPLKKMEQEKLQIELAKGMLVSVDWNQVLRLRVFSDRMVFLSDLQPSLALHRPGLVAFKFPWQADRNVKGGPLTLGKKVFEKGIGVHSYSSVKFPVDSKFNQFSATIGLDPSIRGQGDCVFVVLGDDRELFRQRMRLSDGAKTINVPLGKATTISLIVEYGEMLDLSDNANWCDARLLRKE